MENLLNRRWTLPSPETKIHQVVHRQGLDGRSNFLLNTNPDFHDGNADKHRKNHFYVVRDDLLHPVINGNKARKLDGLLPLLQDYSVTDVVKLYPSTDYNYFLFFFSLNLSLHSLVAHFFWLL
jgi:hypothetical protein